MESNDLTIRILQEIRDEQRATRTELKAEFREMNERFSARFEQVDKRFEVIETTLRDLAQQMVMLSRGIKTALESRTDIDRRVGDLERRMDAVEKNPH